MTKLMEFKDTRQTREIRGGDETILLVEDDAAVRQITRVALQEHGYTVLDGGDARTALQAWTRYQGRVNLLIADLVLPGGMNGAGLAAQLRHCEPGLKVIFISGYNPDAVDLVLQPGQLFLPKPWSVEELLVLVRETLDKS